MQQTQTVALAATVERLRRELEDQRRELRSRTVIEQAKGLLAERLGCGVESAYDHLLQLAADADVEPAVAAALLLGTDIGSAEEPRHRATSIFDPATYLAPLANGTSDGSPGTTAGGATNGTTGGTHPTGGHNGSNGVNGANGSTLADGAPVHARADEDHVEGDGELTPPLAAARHLASAAFAAARSADELARRLTDEALGWLGARAAILTVMEPDGALRVGGSYGLPAHVVSEWTRIPPHTNVGLVRTVRTGTPLWSADTTRLAVVGEAAKLSGPYSCLPLIVGGKIVGAAEITWSQPPDPDDGTRRYVRSVIAACARRLLELAPETTAATEAPWLRAVLDAVQGPCALMSPIRDESGRVVDFHVDAVNSDATDLPGHRPEDLVGVRLLEQYPALAVTDVFQEYVKVLETGVPLRRGPRDYASLDNGKLVPATLSVRACRVGGGLLASWQFHDDSTDLAAQLQQAQRLGNLGWSRWDLTTGDIRWSDQLYTILGRPRSEGPVPLERLADYVVPEDLPHAEHLMRTLLGRREAADLELRVRVGRDVRHLRVMAEPVLDALGEPIALHTVFQDVSQRRRSDAMLAATRQELKRERRRIAEERHIAVELQRAILPLPRGPRQLPGLQVAVRYLPAQSQTRVGGDWYEASALADDEVFLAIGDVSGHGLAAAAAMARMRNALSGLACTGASPDQLLRWLNRLLMQRHQSLTASVIAGRFDPVSRTLTWAQAGHPPPVLLRDGKAEMLDTPDGVLLGALDEPPLALADTRLEPGDLLLFYTDGLVERRDRDLTDGFRVLREAAEAHSDASPDLLIDRVLQAVGAANPNDDTCLLAVQIR
ncbi:SpoIIE family protein phosphatase [Actinomadura barringtoniae]|uniref:SpoIIE family protein phosphatase n=1 Tax=Actinomadura barringtoniae TaxID=1427535 RepID=A0A939PCR2_9ACTN|nr:SpoIIE family protein phosphatase [Actinomadura barringtoniae]MBO2449822.1 SpoIIE family protein phosphatase [Actinomadura barringtoniae]